MGIEQLRQIRENRGKPKEKKLYRIPPKSAKKIAQEEHDRSLRGPDQDTFKEAWFKARRKEMTGICHCGCGEPSQKKDNNYFRHSCCHIFPQAKFESVKYHPLNFVERAFWGGCHGRQDDTSMDRWPAMADWSDIQRKFHILSTFLTEEEKKTKFFSHLQYLVYKS